MWSVNSMSGNAREVCRAIEEYPWFERQKIATVSV
jgi:hypothetical protein